MNADSGEIKRPLRLLSCTNDWHRRVIRMVQQEDDDEAFLYTLKFRVDPENKLASPPL